MNIDNLCKGVAQISTEVFHLIGASNHNRAMAINLFIGINHKCIKRTIFRHLQAQFLQSSHRMYERVITESSDITTLYQTRSDIARQYRSRFIHDENRMP